MTEFCVPVRRSPIKIASSATTQGSGGHIVDEMICLLAKPALVYLLVRWVPFLKPQSLCRSITADRVRYNSIA